MILNKAFPFFVGFNEFKCFSHNSWNLLFIENIGLLVPGDKLEVRTRIKFTRIFLYPEHIRNIYKIEISYLSTFVYENTLGSLCFPVKLFHLSFGFLQRDFKSLIIIIDNTILIKVIIPVLNGLTIQLFPRWVNRMCAD